MSFRTKLTFARFIGIKGLPALLSFKMLNATIRSRHRRIGIQHIMRIKRVHINVDSHIVHDATQRIACPHFPFFILTNGHFFRKRPQQKINGLQFLIRERSCVLPISKSNKPDNLSFTIFKLTDQQGICFMKIKNVNVN